MHVHICLILSLDIRLSGVKLEILEINNHVG